MYSLDERFLSDWEDVSLLHCGGVLKRTIRAGSSRESPHINDQVSVHYEAHVWKDNQPSGRFDSTRERHCPLDFRLGSSQVIRGIDEAVLSMKRHEVCELVVRSDYGYAESGSLHVPADAHLHFQLELLDWRGEDLSPARDGGIIRSVLREGCGWEMPDEGSTIRISLIGRLRSQPDQIFYQHDSLELVLGSSENGLIPSGLTTALKEMKRRERSLIQLSSLYGFGSEGNSSLSVPSDTAIEFEVEMLEFVKLKEAYQLVSESDRLAEVRLLKDHGNRFMQKSEFSLAARLYERCVQLLDDTQLSPEAQETRRSLLLAVHLNLALCHLKRGEKAGGELSGERACVQACDRALAIDGTCEKALFRKAQALHRLNCHVEARQLLLELVKIYPENQAAHQLLSVVGKSAEEAQRQEKLLYRDMFKRLSAQQS